MQMTITSSKPETNVEAFWDNLIVEDTTERFAATIENVDRRTLMTLLDLVTTGRGLGAVTVQHRARE